MSTKRVQKVYLVLLGAVVTCCYLIFISDDSNRTETEIELVEYQSDLCNCSRDFTNLHIRHTDQFNWCGQESALRGGGQRVIVFPFCDNFNLIENVSAAVGHLLPGWLIRIHHTLTEDQFAVHLCDTYCRFDFVDFCNVSELIENIPDGWSVDANHLQRLNRLMYGYLPLMDHNVDIYMSRDVNSWLTKRQVAAVNEWLDSDYTFHAVRDRDEQVMSAGKLIEGSATCRRFPELIQFYFFRAVGS